VNGVRNAFNAAVKIGAKKFIHISSVAAMYGDQKKINPNHIWTSKDWNEAHDTHPYYKSKADGEKLLWRLAEEHPEIDVVSILPAATFGPLIDINSISSLSFVKNIVFGEYHRNPKQMDDLMGFGFGFINVRDVADSVLKSIERTFANGKRFVLANIRDTNFIEIANVIRELYPDFNIAHEDRHIPINDVTMEISDTTALLGRRLINLQETISESVESLKKFNLLQVQ